jgi:hypothetical protein
MSIKRLTFLIIVFIYLSGNVLAEISDEQMVFRGIYQGKDLFIMNPMLNDGVDYCVKEVTINDVVFNDVLNTSAFRISPSIAGLDYGEAYEVVIKHEATCTPTLVNPAVLKPLSSFEVIEYDLGFGDQLRFTTDKECGKLTFYLEEYRWGRWVQTGEVKGNGGPGENTYSIKVYPFAGKNMFRLYQEDHLLRRKYSDELTIDYIKNNVEILTNLKRVRKEIEFSEETRFIIVNEFGEEMKNGSGKLIDVSDLPKGTYYLNFENEFVNFNKR